METQIYKAYIRNKTEKVNVNQDINSFDLAAFVNLGQHVLSLDEDDGEEINFEHITTEKTPKTVPDVSKPPMSITLLQMRDLFGTNKR